MNIYKSQVKSSLNAILKGLERAGFSPLNWTLNWNSHHWSDNHTNTQVSVGRGCGPPAGGPRPPPARDPSPCLRHFRVSEDRKKSSRVCSEIGHGITDLLLLKPMRCVLFVCSRTRGKYFSGFLHVQRKQTAGVAGAQSCQVRQNKTSFLSFPPPHFSHFLSHWKEFSENNSNNKNNKVVV